VTPQILMFSIVSMVFVFGLIVGSFLNVCIARIPHGESVVRPRSKCPRCGTLIRWYQNIPVASYVVLRGKCAHCSAKISLRYPLVELLNALLYALVIWYYGFSWATPIYWVFASMLIVVTFIDLDFQIIPNVISLPGIVLGFCLSPLIPWLGWQDSLIGIVVGGGCLWVIAVVYMLIAKTEGMGMGDVKLLAMIGGFLGYKALLPVILISSVVGSIVGIVLIGLSGKGRKLEIPFGPYLSLGAVLVLIWGDRMVDWYFSLF